ncbi:MAG: DMT family transporter, partial [Pseudomonadota bacterium]
NVTAVFQLVPLAMTAAAAVYLKERVGWRRWSAAAVGLAGVVLIIRPGTAEFSWWYVAVLAAVVVVTARDIATRFIDRATPTLIVVFLTAVAVTLAGVLLLPFETWKTPEMHHLVRLAAAAMLCCAGYYALIECWRDGDVSATAPFRYSVVLWAILFGALFLGEMPTYWTLAGSAIVMGAGLYTFVRERQLANRG